MSPVNPGCGLQHQRDSVSVAEPVAVPETAGSAALAPDGEGGKTSGMESGELVSRLRRSEEHTSELQSRGHLVCRLLLEKKNHRHELKSRRSEVRVVRDK